MNESQAIRMANEFVLTKTGVRAQPDSVRLMYRQSGSYWSLVYRAEWFFPKAASGAATVDGPYQIRVDDASGEVSVAG
jgi:hypothetical protein